MTGLKKTIEFCLPKNLIIPRGEAEGKQNSKFPEGPVIKCFLYLATQKKKEKKVRMICLMPAVAVPVVQTEVETNELSYQNDKMTVFFFAANKK